MLTHIQSPPVGPENTPYATPGSLRQLLMTAHIQEAQNLKNKVQTLFCFFIKAQWPLGFIPPLS